VADYESPIDNPYEENVREAIPQEFRQLNEAEAEPIQVKNY
jgi:hypothetical protein